MAIYENSRYNTKLPIFYDRRIDTQYVGFPITVFESSEDDFIYEVQSGETLEYLAYKFYNNPQLKWIILYANPNYTTEFDIQTGDSIVIPTKERVETYVDGFK